MQGLDHSLGSCSLWELLVEKGVGLWGTASGLELAELSPSSARDRAEGKASNRSLGVLGAGLCPPAMQLDTHQALGKYLMGILQVSPIPQPGA